MSSTSCNRHQPRKFSLIGIRTANNLSFSSASFGTTTNIGNCQKKMFLRDWNCGVLGEDLVDLHIVLNWNSGTNIIKYLQLLNAFIPLISIIIRKISILNYAESLWFLKNCKVTRDFLTHFFKTLNPYYMFLIIVI